MYYNIPTNPRAAKPVLQRFLQENAAVAAGNISGRRRPMPPRNLIAQQGSLETLVTWNAPQNMNGVLGFNVYQGNEGNLVYKTTDPTVRQARIKLAAATPTRIYVSCFNAMKESVLVSVAAEANTNEYVTSGTSGGTGGTSPNVPPGYPNEPSGGGGSKKGGTF